MPTCLHQCPLSNEHSRDPWGNCWALSQPTNLFCGLSKNTGTLNLRNLDILAVTKELMLLGASIFTAQEMNVHWHEETSSHLHTQGQHATTQFQLATSTSTEKTSDWFKPGGTIAMALNQWTGQVIQSGLDPLLGCWSHLEFIGKNDQCLVILSGCHVCNQQFDAALQMVTAQQIRLWQASDIPNTKHCTIFINNLI